MLVRAWYAHHNHNETPTLVAGVPKSVTVLVSPSYLDRFDDVVERVQAAGLQVEDVLRTTGVIAGAIESDRIDALRSVDGVAAVEIQRTIQLPPPASRIQ
jgi:hypothetical protein